VVKFWWRSGSPSGHRIVFRIYHYWEIRKVINGHSFILLCHMVALVRCALADVCSLPVLLALNWPSAWFTNVRLAPLLPFSFILCCYATLCYVLCLSMGEKLCFRTWDPKFACPRSADSLNIPKSGHEPWTYSRMVSVSQNQPLEFGICGDVFQNGYPSWRKAVVRIQQREISTIINNYFQQDGRRAGRLAR